MKAEKAELGARRDHENDARKRIYEKCRPLVFQLAELFKSAFRMFSLVRNAKGGKASPVLA